MDKMVVDPGAAGFDIPTVDADPVVVKTKEFTVKMNNQITLIADQMLHRAEALELKAKELRARAEKMVNYGVNLCKDINEFTETVVEYHFDAQSLSSVEPKDPTNE